MNKINRSLVKSQARQIIKGKVFYLFIITFVVSVLTGGISVTFSFVNEINSINNYNNSRSDDYNYGDFGNYFDYNYDDDDDDFYYDGENPIENFELNSKSANDSALQSIIGAADRPATIYTNVIPFAFAGLGMLSNIIALVFIPLTVTLAGMYVALIRRNSNEHFNFGGEFSGIFKNTFNDTFLKKFVLIILVGLLTFALSLLFIIPGIIFSYSAYFSLQIMYDYPNLKPSEAIKLSKKIIKGNRTELFVFDLSFIPWYLLTAITFGLAGIYTLPYIETAKALYYENFRLRAIAEGRITEDDFLSEEERIMKYNGFNQNNNQQNYYTQNNNTYQNIQYQPYNTPEQNYVNINGTFYNPDFSPIEQSEQYTSPVQSYQEDGGYYYEPQNSAQNYEHEQPVQQTEPQYYTPETSAQTSETKEEEPSVYDDNSHTEESDDNTDKSNNFDNE